MVKITIANPMYDRLLALLPMPWETDILNITLSEAFELKFKCHLVKYDEARDEIVCYFHDDRDALWFGLKHG